jgi:hypothetical protein
MYAELELKICRICKIEKHKSQFSSFKKKNGKLYPRPFCKECKSQGNFEWDLWKNYRIRLEDYQKLYEDQNGRCACCGQLESSFKRNLHVDHDHESGKVRGLLCTQCNPGLGYFKHSIDRLKLGIIYLEKFKK